MTRYIVMRVLLMVPTLLAVLLLNFIIVQAAPGGPVEQMLSRVEGMNSSAALGGGSDGVVASGDVTRGTRGIDPVFIEELNTQFGFDKPPWQRFVIMVGHYARLDFGDSFFRGQSVTDLIIERLPVSISLGLWSTLLVYLISVPLGILKAVRQGSRFDLWSSALVIVGYAIPGFLFALLLIVVFAGAAISTGFRCAG